ncbi:MAG TPA: 50S ribosomal protein L32e [Thermoplasmata archaeon]|nr:50S ribosomal protein L32e [Thermoplasmata archaeon]
MADAPTPATTAAEAPAPPKRRRKAAPKEEAPPAKPAAKKADADEPKAPRRATLAPERRRLLTLRRTLDGKRPIFGRQAANRYWRIGRDGAWRRPRGLQSKQRRHYGYRSQIVSIGYRSPAAVRGLAPNGFRPVIVRTDADLERIDVATEAAVIARTVGTRRRIVLEETARRLGIHLLNPIVKSEREA